LNNTVSIILSLYEDNIILKILSLNYLLITGVSHLYVLVS